MTSSPRSVVASSREFVRSAGRSKGFTLVELLVVIGIIALLISILLPTLASARRSANSVKCLAGLKEIGQAFNMYAMENKGYYPATRDTVTPKIGGGTLDRRWTDYISKYINRKGADFTKVADIMQIRKSSVLWGCPEWSRSFEYNPNATYDVYTGYGMNPRPGYPDKHNSTTMNAHRIALTAQGYIKQSVYGRNGSNRLLLSDSTYDFIQLPTNGYTANVLLAPWDQAAYNPVAPANDFYIDVRHVKPGMGKEGGKSVKGTNVLFADGHAASATPKEAYNAIRLPGSDFVPNVPK